MVVMVANLCQVQMEILPGHPVVRIQPVLGVALGALNAVDVIAPDRLSLPLADHHMLATQLQRGIGLPFVRVVQSALAGVRFVARMIDSRSCVGIGMALTWRCI